MDGQYDERIEKDNHDTASRDHDWTITEVLTRRNGVITIGRSLSEITPSRVDTSVNTNS